MKKAPVRVLFLFGDTVRQEPRCRFGDKAE